MCCYSGLCCASGFPRRKVSTLLPAGFRPGCQHSSRPCRRRQLQVPEACGCWWGNCSACSHAAHAPMSPVSSPRPSICRVGEYCFLTTPPTAASLFSFPCRCQVLLGPEPSRSLSLLCPPFSAWWQWAQAALVTTFYSPAFKAG